MNHRSSHPPSDSSITVKVTNLDKTYSRGNDQLFGSCIKVVLWLLEPVNLKKKKNSSDLEN